MTENSSSLYVSLPPLIYRDAKSQGLASQASLLRMMKHVQKLKILARQKRELRERLIKLSETVEKELKRIENKFPEPKVPKKFRKKKHKKHKTKEDKLDLKIKRDYSKRAEIDDELMQIQEKLAALRG